MRDITKKIITFFAVIVVLGAIYAMVSPRAQAPTTVGIDELVRNVNNDEVKSIVVENDTATATLNNDQKIAVLKERNQPLTEVLANFGVSPDKLQKISITVQEESAWKSFLGASLQTILYVVLFFGIFYFFMRQVQGSNSRVMSFGQSSPREATPDKTRHRVTFKDVAGVKEAKQELEEVVEFLKSPRKFTELGAKIPKGVLLMGAPGCGKTLLAKAVAGEADVPFFNISGSEFVEMFVGVGASRVRDLFVRAKKSAPCIIFIDEIDAVGRQRGSGMGGSHDEREQTLNQILVEMDGFDPNLGVIVIAATNRPDVLDPALLRPGRFDRRIVLDEPNLDEREAILKIHARNKPLAQGVDLHMVAARTPGFTGADLANVLNEAAIFTARENRKRIEQRDILDSIEKVMLGPERRSRVFSEQERKITAYHEAGHALVAHLLEHADPVHKISIISRGRAAGYTLKLPLEDRHFRTKNQFLDDLAVSMGGYSAEEIIFGELTTGASNDLRQATQMARKLITEYGMSEKLGPRTFGQKEEMIFLGRDIHESRDYSEKVAESIDKEVSGFLNNAHGRAREIINTHRDALEKIATALLAKETLEKEEFEALLEGVS